MAEKREHTSVGSGEAEEQGGGPAVAPDGGNEHAPTIAAGTEGAGAIQGSPPPPLRGTTSQDTALWFCLLIALVIRVWLVMRTHGIIDGDEALLGIQAQHILHGDFPIYFPGQP